MCILHATMARGIVFADAATLSVHADQPSGLCDYGDELMPKARKPYTITKQREKWTDEEHEKFLEALKLYGRAWRNIEEHVGSKTAIQIRSHAQKFFTKVVRESAGGSNGSPMDIPPPRPKKRPNHPYPRKLTILPTKGIPSLLKGEGCSYAAGMVDDQEKESPTSVLSPVGSDIMSSHGSGVTGHCGSLDSSTTGQTGQETVRGSDSSVSEEDHSSPSQTSNSDAPVSHNTMESKQGATLMSFQLFGRTVMVVDPQMSHKEGNSVTNQLTPPAPKQSEKAIAEDPSPASGHCSCGLLPFFYPMPIYGNSAFPPIQSFLSSSRHDCPLSDSKTSESKKRKDASPVSPAPPRMNATISQRQGASCHTRCTKKGLAAARKGFVPYKQRTARQQSDDGESRKQQRIKLC